MPADVVLVGIGAIPNTEWLRDSPLELANGVVCDAGGATAVPNVVAVGGTSLTLTSGGNYGSEIGWRSGGGGTSKYVSKPTYQTDVSTPSSTKRTSPDVHYVSAIG